MNYEEMSDFEINSEVAKHKFEVFSACHDGSRVNGNVRVNGDEFDPCNNPSDAWPIIWSNGISIVNDETCKFATINAQESCEPMGSDAFEVAIAGKVGPMRAAMICFLKMKDAEK